MENNMNKTYCKRKEAEKLAEEQAMSYIMWGAGRAAAIAFLPLPLADVGPLMVNESYMIYKIAAAYGYSIDKSVVAMLIGIAGSSLSGKILVSFIPFLKVPLVAGITYAVGKAAKAYFASGMTLSKEILKEEFLKGRKEAEAIDWEEVRKNQ